MEPGQIFEHRDAGLWTVCYEWQGETHSELQDLPRPEAAARVQELRDDKWQAWMRRAG